MDDRAAAVAVITGGGGGTAQQLSENVSVKLCTTRPNRRLIFSGHVSALAQFCTCMSCSVSKSKHDETELGAGIASWKTPTPVFNSAKSLVTNRGGISTKLAGTYTQPAAIPPMPWLSGKAPAAPGVSALVQGGNTIVQWQPGGDTAKIAIQARNGGIWKTAKITYAGAGQTSIPRADAIAITALDRFGNASPPKVLGLP